MPACQMKVILPILPKIGCRGKATSLEGIGKIGPDQSSTNKHLSFGAEIAKIGQVNPEIICL